MQELTIINVAFYAPINIYSLSLYIYIYIIYIYYYTPLYDSSARTINRDRVLRRATATCADVSDDVKLELRRRPLGD